MISVAIYINGKKLDLFGDETIEINSSVQKINDLGKVFTEYSQSFTVPGSDVNNKMFKHYYNVDINNSFNANMRQPAFIEIGTYTFKVGVIQLNSVSVKKGKISFYTLMFFGNLKNLNDLFGDDELSVLDFSHLDHPYNEQTVFKATRENNISNGSIYYPLISSIRNFEAGTLNSNDILTNDGSINFTDLKPAIQLYEIIKATEVKYGVSFTRTFFDRAIFTKLYMWLHNTEEKMKVLGNYEYIDMTVNQSDDPIFFNAANNTVTYSGFSQANTTFLVIPSPGFENTEYTFTIEVNGENVITLSSEGQSSIEFSSTVIRAYTLKFKIKSAAGFQFASRISTFGLKFPNPHVYIVNALNPEQTLIGGVSINDQLPKLKVTEFFTSLIRTHNLVIIPIDSTHFEIMPLDDWYSKGKIINITGNIDSDVIGIKKPNVYKEIFFKYKSSGTILNEKFRTNQGGEIGYGDLKAKYDVDGSDFSIDPNFENLLFERLRNNTNGTTTNIQVGKSIANSGYIDHPIPF
ncbi:hypothetical protein [Flavobacterium kingsejongi]|uniref:Uncharacterized protein n=1 Tax=Flavobacterium kingsejongi TaxID=1678728 RepID=A0A2S1LQG6_9FLAO|nr:hypothetical protein [Flavobacterium kingsejongi]AWG26000.1 hypothetical protein FK004_12590 [Flavobacterium kingsejongi]